MLRNNKINRPANEINPPWIKFPGFPPGDPFWRQSGEAWFFYVWEPYWKSLSEDGQKEYLCYWDVPNEWQLFYFDPDFRQWLESTDN